MATALPRLVDLKPCGHCGGAHQAILRIEGMHVLTCERVKDNGLYLHWSQGRPYLVTGPERTCDARKG